MSQGKLSIIGLLIGTVIGAISGVAFPETRFEPIFIGVITVCGGITGLLIGFACGLFIGTDNERKTETFSTGSGPFVNRGANGLEPKKLAKQEDNPAIYAHYDVIDRNLKSKSPWLVLAACTFGTPLIVSLAAMRGTRRQGEKLDPSVLPIIVGVSTVIGLAIGLTVVAHSKYKHLQTTKVPVPFWLRLLFDGQPMKLIFVGIPLIFIVAIAIGVIMA